MYRIEDNDVWITGVVHGARNWKPEQLPDPTQAIGVNPKQFLTGFTIYRIILIHWENAYFFLPKRCHYLLNPNI